MKKRICLDLSFCLKKENKSIFLRHNNIITKFIIPYFLCSSVILSFKNKKNKYGKFCK